jgi:predicted HicB family RNase H-like nuclease
MVIKGNIEEELEYYAKLPYTVIVEQWDDGKGPYWVARIAELPHCLIHADTPEEATREIQDVRMDWIRSNLERGLPIPEPRPRKYSGQIRLRISPSLHRLLTYRAETEGMSLNQHMATVLAMSAGIAKEPAHLRKARRNTIDLHPGKVLGARGKLAAPQEHGRRRPP